MAANDSVQSDIAPASWGNPDTLQTHVEDHASDFGIDPLDPNAQENYARQANEFLQRSFDEGLPTKIEDEGYIRIYDPASNTFGSYNPSGTTRTFFSPPNGQAYFDEQPGTLFIGGKPVDSPSTSDNVEPVITPASNVGASEPVAIKPNPLVEEPIIIEEPIILP